VQDYAVKGEFDRFKASEWDCKKVNVDGVIKPGRFFVKRNRGKQEGYLVLAPFVVETDNTETYVRSPESYEASNQHRKFIINLGWIPRSRKHLVYTTVPENVIGEETYQDREEALRKQDADGLIRDPLQPELSVPVTNVTAYVRRGEQEDRLNGRINWADNLLYKWINLQELTRVFRVFNEEEGETVYLERTAKRYLSPHAARMSPKPSPSPPARRPSSPTSTPRPRTTRTTPTASSGSPPPSPSASPPGSLSSDSTSNYQSYQRQGQGQGDGI
jgi:hypothetical protein